MKLKILGAVVIVFMFAFSMAYAAPVDLAPLTQDQDGVIWESQGGGSGLLSNVSLSVAGEVSYVPERELDVDGGIAQAGFGGAKFVLCLDQKYNLYVTVGEILSPEISGHITNSTGVVSQVVFDIQNDSIWGVGLSGIIKEWADMGLKLIGDAAYRNSKMDIDDMTIDGIEYSGTGITVDNGAEWTEWHVALAVSKDLGILTPYVGVKYSDVLMSASAAYNTQNTWTFDDVESDSIIGVFGGITIKPMKAVSIDLQGSFLDESSVSASVKVKF